MKRPGHIAGSIIIAAALFAASSAIAQTPSWTVPPDSARCPSKWGAADERGAGNLMGPKSVLHAAKLIKTGVMIDVAGYKGVDMLGDTYEITVADLEGALKKQNLTLQSGDAVIIHTGWGKLWDKDNARYTKSNPGIGVPAAQWLIAKEPMLLGSDNTPVEVSDP